MRLREPDRDGFVVSTSGLSIIVFDFTVKSKLTLRNVANYEIRTCQRLKGAWILGWLCRTQIGSSRVERNPAQARCTCVFGLWGRCYPAMSNSRDQPGGKWPGDRNSRFLMKWCGWSESNRHSFRNRILSPARLPVPPHPHRSAEAVRYGPNWTAGWDIPTKRNNVNCPQAQVLA